MSSVKAFAPPRILLVGKKSQVPSPAEQCCKCASLTYYYHHRYDQLHIFDISAKPARQDELPPLRAALTPQAPLSWLECPAHMLACTVAPYSHLLMKQSLLRPICRHEVSQHSHLSALIPSGHILDLSCKCGASAVLQIRVPRSSR